MGVEMKNLRYNLEEAQKTVFTRCAQMPEEEVALENSYGRILAEDVCARQNVPDFAKSPLDGYAFYAGDTAHADSEHPVRLKVTGEIAAGSFSDETLEHGCAVHILTGAPLPPGADAIEKFECTREETDAVWLSKEYASGQNIVQAGEDVRKGELLAEAGDRIDSAMAGLFASQGIDRVKVFKTMQIGIISQGSELREPGEACRQGQIYNSSRYLLEGALKAHDLGYRYEGIVSDHTDEICALLKKAAQECDAVIMTGGVSVGTYDLTEDALRQAGAEILIDQIAMKPGSSCCIALLDGRFVFGLSGNPTAAMTTFYLLALPALLKISGMTAYLPPKIQVSLADDFTKSSKGMRIVKGHIQIENGHMQLKLNEKQQNGSVSAMKNAQLFGVIPAGSGPQKKGTVLDAYVIAGE